MMMVDQNKTDAETAAEAPAKVVETAAKTAEAVVKTDAKAVKSARTKARRAAAKAAKAPKTTKTTARRVNKTRRTKPAAKRAAPKIERTATMNYDATNWFANFGAMPAADRFQGLFADAGERSQEIVRKSQKAAEQLAEIAKANVEALTEAGRIAASGARSIGQDALASGREGIEQASAAVKTLAEAKSPTEFFQLQSELARASFDRVVAEGSKLTEQFVKLAGEAVQPLSTRASLNAERINELAA
jgi:phasin family protein